MSDRALLARIAKCLALSKSANEHEAAAALAKARALMAEHGLTEADIAMADVSEQVARASRTRRPPRWEAILCRSVRRALQVEAFVDRNGDRRYVGRGPRPEIASYAFVALFRRLKSARSAHIRAHLRRCKAATKRQRADAFCEGWALAVLDKVSALAPAAEPDDGIRRYLAKHYPSLAEIETRAASVKGRAYDDFARGLINGEGVNLHHGVGGAQRLEIAHG